MKKVTTPQVFEEVYDEHTQNKDLQPSLSPHSFKISFSLCLSSNSTYSTKTFTQFWVRIMLCINKTLDYLIISRFNDCGTTIKILNKKKWQMFPKRWNKKNKFPKKISHINVLLYVYVFLKYNRII